MADQFKVGERVRFLRERQEGVVQRIISNSRLEVLIDDFVEMEVGTAEVVRINASEAIFKREDEEKPVQVGATPIGAEREPVFVVMRTATRDYELWILNHSRRELFFTAFQKANGKFKGLNAAALIPGERRMFALMSTHEFHMVQSLHFQIMQFIQGEKARPLPIVTLEISVKSDILNIEPEVIPELGTDGWEFMLEEKAVEPYSEAAKQVLFVPPVQGPEIVDLHIEKLVDSLMGISSAHMLQIQLEHFEKAITDAQLSKAKSLVFIHGSGSGKLRKEIHEKMRNLKFVKSFEQADPLRYGNGATMVYF